VTAWYETAARIRSGRVAARMTAARPPKENLDRLIRL